jgi:hypothetical protein
VGPRAGLDTEARGKIIVFLKNPSLHTNSRPHNAQRYCRCDGVTEDEGLKIPGLNYRQRHVAHTQCHKIASTDGYKADDHGYHWRVTKTT